MICPECKGSGIDPNLTATCLPCYECGGYGITHCCEGDQAMDVDHQSDPISNTNQHQACEPNASPDLSASADQQRHHPCPIDVKDESVQ